MSSYRSKRDSLQVTSTRFLLVVAFFVLCFGVVGMRLVHLQVNQHEFLREKAISQRRDRIKKKMLRGTIYDRSGRTLAMSIKAKSLYANPQEIENPEKVASVLATLLKLKSSELLRSLMEAKQEGKKFVWIARKLDEDEATKITESLKKAFPESSEIKGFYWQEEQKRSYPLGTLAASVLGFVNIDDVGQAGIEMSQEDYLHGAIIRRWQERDRLGRVYESESEEREPPKDVYLTISASIQYKVEAALRKGVENARAKSGVAIVLEPKTGEILAMASYPSFDPNFYNRFTAESFINRAIQTVYSPGSTFKVISYSAALDKNLIAPDSAVNCSNGQVQIADRKFRDSHCRDTYEDSIVVSSNIAAIRAVEKLDKSEFFSYIRAFGFGEKTGVELPSESAGLLSAPERWSGASMASIAIGYEIGVTALQMATAFSTIANDGVRVRPHLVKEVRHSDGEIFRQFESEERRVIKVETAQALKKMLQQVVLRGTGKLADLHGYTAAGKTGTAWKYDEKLKKYNPEKYVSSFIGFAPVDKPSVVIAVVLDEPRVGRRNGGDVAAPIFREIAEQILPEMQVPPDEELKTKLIAESKNTKNGKNARVEEEIIEETPNFSDEPPDGFVGKRQKESAPQQTQSFREKNESQNKIKSERRDRKVEN